MYQLQFQKKILVYIDIDAMFSPISSISSTTPIEPIPVVRPLAKLSISFELRQWLAHSTRGSPREANCHDDYDGDGDGEHDNDLYIIGAVSHKSHYFYHGGW